MAGFRTLHLNYVAGYTGPFLVTRESASEQWVPKRPGDAHLTVSIRNHWRRLRRGWSPVPAIGPFYSARTVSSPSPACQALDKKSWWEAKSLLASVVLAHRGYLWQSISTVYQFFLVWGHIDGRYQPIFLVWIHINSRFWPIFGWNRRSIEYWPYFQVGESLLTVNIDHILKHGSEPFTRSKLSKISQWQKSFSELKISNPRISCTLNGVRRSSWKVVWVTKSSFASETNFRWQIFCSCSWRATDMC